MPRIGIEGGSHSWAEFTFSPSKGENLRDLRSQRGVFLSANSKIDSYFKSMNLRSSASLLEEAVEGLSTVMSDEDARALVGAVVKGKIGQSWNLIPKEDETGKYEVIKNRTSTKLKGV